MEKKVLSEQSLYYGNIDMPKGFEINQKKLVSNILKEKFTNKESIFSRDWDMLNTYIRDHIRLEYSFNLIEKKSFGDIYKPSELSKPLLNVDLVDLRNSPDFTMLYGIKVDKCWVKIYFDDNRRKGKSYDIELKNNMFIMFPSTNMYYITNNQKDSLNFIQTITYESI
jgi:hypothetical protein